MEFDLALSTDVLNRTPKVLSALLADLQEEWVFNNDGQDTWSPFDILGHLIHGERTDWLPRARIILQYGTSRPFEPFDRFAQLRESKGKSVVELLEEFAQLREANLNELQAMRLTEAKLDLKGIHPDFGEVSMRQLLATWVAHDLSHLAQIRIKHAGGMNHPCAKNVIQNTKNSFIDEIE